MTGGLIVPPGAAPSQEDVIGAAIVERLDLIASLLETMVQLQVGVVSKRDVLMSYKKAQRMIAESEAVAARLKAAETAAPGDPGPIETT